MLTIRVNSFSYRRGLPEDPSGNGGGFVFDCRALHNPGRYEQYKSLCGLDRPVIDFLEAEENVHKFLDACKRLICQSVDCYLDRGFEHLMVSFGCTGGQHRSVFCAQTIGDFIASTYPQVKVEICHMEQEILKKK